MINRYKIQKLQDLQDTGTYDDDLDAKIEAEEERQAEAAISMIEEAKRGYRVND